MRVATLGVEFRVVGKGLGGLTRIRSTTERAPGLRTACISQRERSAVEANAQHDLAGWNVDAPKQLGGKLDFCKIGMALDDAADWILSVPDPVKIVRHEVDPVRILEHVGKVKPAQIPERAWRGEGNAIFACHSTGQPRVKGRWAEVSSCVYLPIRQM